MFQAKPEQAYGVPGAFRNSRGEIQVWVVDLQAAQDLVDRAALMLAMIEQERAARFKAQPSWREFVLSRSILRTLPSRLLGTQPTGPDFSYNEHGKPRLVPDSCPIRFDLSHSSDVVVYAITLG